MKVIRNNKVLYSSADGASTTTSWLPQTTLAQNTFLPTSPSTSSPALTQSNLQTVKNVVKGLPVKTKVKTPIRGKIVKNKNYKPGNTGVAGGGIGGAGGSSTGGDTQPTSEETKTGFWAGLSTTQKGLVVIGGAILAYMGYKKFINKGQ